MIYAFIAIPVFVFFLIFAWGAAPSWQFERLWSKRFGGEQPDSATMINLGLVPPARRQASFLVFLVLTGVIFGSACFFSPSAILDLLMVAMGAAGAGAGFGLVLHQIGPGKVKIEQFFEKM